MKLFGFASDNEHNSIIEMKVVAICFESPEHAQKFATFAKECAEKMLVLGDDYNHEHFAGGQHPDITIERLVKANRL